MDERATGLILRIRPLTETSLIVHWLTKEFGRIGTVAKGARRPKSALLGKLDLFYLADLSFQQSRRSELHTLREVSVRDYHKPLRQELGYLQQASYFAQLLEQTTETDTPLPGLFELLDEALNALPRATPRPETVFALEMKLLSQLGFQPDLADSGLTPGGRELLTRLAKADWDLVGRLKLSSAQVRELGAFLERFLFYHFGRCPKARTASLTC
jgi:DNA repair protein RecO (recombination protein O)